MIEKFTIDAYSENASTKTIYISKYLDFLAFQKKLSVRTRQSYGLDVGHIFRKFLSGPDLSLAQIFNLNLVESPEGPILDLKIHLPSAEKTTEIVREYFVLNSNLAPATRSRRIVALRTFFLWVSEQWPEYLNCLPSLHSPKVQEQIPHFISVDEALALLKSAEAKALNPSTASRDIYILILLLYGCGLRISEACNARWDALNLETGSLKVIGKGSKERIISIPSGVVATLKQLRQKGTFILGEGEGITSARGYHMIRQAGRDANLVAPLHPHALRHSYATHLLRSGGSLRAIQELLGHSNLNSTQKYLHLTIDDLGRAMESFHPLGDKKKITE